ncbi:MAG: sensor histidine kinase [Clostridia bacterium]|nr:sensor histidine kinase [Clostridia bacterium]
MKHWYRTYTAKTVCFILCLLSLAMAVGTVIGAVWMIEYEFYTRPAQYIWEEEVSHMLRTDAQVALTHSIRMEDSKEVSSYYYYSGHILSSDSTNVRVSVCNPDGKETFTNVEKNETPLWEREYRFDVRWEMSSLGSDDGLRIYYLYGDDVPEGEVHTVKVALLPGLPVTDSYALIHTLIFLGHALRFWIYPIGLLSLLLAVVCVILLIVSSGRRPEHEEPVPGPLHRVPFDLLVGIALLGFLFLGYLSDMLYTGNLILGICIVAIIVLAVSVVLGLIMSAAARIKCGTFLKNTVIWMALRLIWFVLRWIWRIFVILCCKIWAAVRAIPILWRTALLVIGLGCFDVILVALAWNAPELALFLALVEFVAVAILSLYSAWVMRRLKQSGEALAKGDLNHRTDTGGMLWDFKNHGENLNRIGDGMARAVEERLKSERMKAELVTNVSHDIKTPLTSIINYADLIAAEPCSSPHHKEYAEVLMRKSQHLKRLLADLVEISKANTGNLEVELSPCDAGVLLTQASGEFEQKCREAGLTLITSQPESPIRFLADGRRIWRVFENLMSNACKYSLPGSRVYLTLQVTDGQACFLFRNTSRAALNVSPDELMERFVRGDASRTTEGNGLGLSIARSLTELQGGRMELAIDGDLFKVTLRFPLFEG